MTEPDPLTIPVNIHGKVNQPVMNHGGKAKVIGKFLLSNVSHLSLISNRFTSSWEPTQGLVGTMPPYITSESLSEKTNQWMETVRPFNRNHLELCTKRAALIVIDMQRFFLTETSPSFTEGGPAIIPTIARLIATFRSARRPVFYTRHVHHPSGRDAGILGWWWKGMCLEGSPESEVTEALAPLPEDKVILKRRYSAFYNTDLEVVLRGLGITDLVVTGIMSNMCCETTARDAYMRDLNVFFPADASASINEAMHVATLLNLSLGFASICKASDIEKTVAAQQIR